MTRRSPMPRLAVVVVSALLVVVVSVGTSLRAQTAPATRMALPEGPLTVRITAVEGIVQARTAPDQKWEKAATGMELAEGAELRTGPRSAVRFAIGDDQV